MAVYGSQFVEGKVQEGQYSTTSALLFFAPKLGGMDIKPTSVYYTIYNGDGDAVSTTSSAMTLCTIEDHGWLGFDALTARYNVGATLSNASAGFSATIRDVQYTSPTAGRVYLTNIIKTVSNNRTIVDNGDTPGSATTEGTPYSPVLYASINFSSTTTYTIGENYRLKVRWTYGGQTHYDHVYFDVVYYPIDVMTTSRMIDDVHPDWNSMRPKEWQDWKLAIHAGHAELCRRIRALGNRPAFIVKREELLPYEMAFVEAEIARNSVGFEQEQRDYWASRAESIWTSKGEFAYAGARDDGEIDANPMVLTHTLTR
jgi:hypothetical protein